MTSETSETPDPPRPIAGSLEDIVLSGLIDTFFEPRMIGWHTQSVPDGHGGYVQTPVPTVTQSPLALMAEAMFGRYRTEILEQLWSRVDLEALAQAVADRVSRYLVDKITDVQPNYSGRSSIEERLTGTGKQVRERSLELVATELARRQLEGLDAGSTGSTDNPTE